MKQDKHLTPENCDVHRDQWCPELDKEKNGDCDWSDGGLISRSALLEKAVEVPGWFSKAVSTWDIVHFPAVKATPLVFSTWVRDGDFLVCLNCESEINVRNSLGAENKKNFCPCCGARMVKE